MKLITHILIFHFIILSLLPCSGGFGECMVDMVQQNSIDDLEGSGCDDIDYCNPLCNCQCYGSVVNTFSLEFEFILPSILSKNFNGNLNKIDFFNLSFSIWQPPKIA